MADEQINPPLPAADQAYLDSRGATPLPDAAEPVQKPEPVAAPEAKPAQDTRTVPLPALQEERRERQRIERELADQREKWARLEERFNTVSKQPEPVIPDADTDPVARLKYLDEKFAKLETESAEQVRQRQQAEQVQAMQREFLGRYQAAAAEFQAKAPDFMEAYSHLRADRAAELEAMGFTDPGMRSRIMEQEELGVAMQAFQAGRNPAEVMYALAGRRGYKAKAAEAKPDGKQPDLQTIAKGQQAASSLSGSGSATPPDLTLESVANMSTDEFEAWMSEPKNAKRWDQMKRGAA